DIAESDYDCLICYDSVTPRSKVWACDVCSHVFHLSCVQKWASKTIENNSTASNTSSKWRCPGCQTVRESVPKLYKCWCGKVTSPHAKSSAIPHSCGKPCGVKHTECNHECHILCHPGPHPPCQETGITTRCFCGKRAKQDRCADIDYSGWSCGEICNETMPCGMHVCQRACHSGLCGPCQSIIDVFCYCGKEVYQRKCSERVESKRSVVQLGAEVRVWDGAAQCHHICNRPYDCGVHLCPKPCHPQTMRASHCPYSPDVATTCPCKKRKVSEILGRERESCSEPVPTCGQQCDKPLPCGHTCELSCHEGPCNPCEKSVWKECVCGYSSVEVICGQTPLGTKPTCQRVCQALLNCHTHKCGKTCCSGERHWAKRTASRRRRDFNSDAASIEPEHICTRVCDKLLPCGSHRCTNICHRGPCQPCLEAIFEEIECNCGRTRLMPPQPCGTKHPHCKYNCQRRPPCGHPPVPHNCHLDDEQCPPCPHLVTKRCLCGKAMVKNQACSKTRVFCGEVCGKPLPCGLHKCTAVCHEAGECPPCTNACGKLRPCGHKDMTRCHAPFECNTRIPCRSQMKTSCECGEKTAVVQCNSTKDDPYPNHTLKCDEECLKLQRDRRLAQALKVNSIQSNDPRSSISMKSPFSEYLLDYYSAGKSERDFCDGIENIMTEFVSSSSTKHYSFPAMPQEGRRIVHEFASAFGCDSIAHDPEPKRNVVVYKTMTTRTPPVK
ncbi:hypothetical protein CANCADRAFT_19649, partial [Tortispora caseinolytica NRRL Y-17796]